MKNMILNPDKKVLHGRFISFCVILFVLGITQVNAQYSYDYSKIADHPRLLLTKVQEDDIKESLKRNPEFRKIDEYIKKIADNTITEEPLIFKKDGKRLLAVSRRALTRLYYLSYSYRLTGDKKYLNRAEEELNAISEFESWNPSHFLDVGEMCMAVSIAYDWLYKDLQESTKKNVRKAIIEKAFKPSYVKEDAWFLERHNNWNSVCNAGLVYGALAIMEYEKEQSIAIIERALKSNLLPLETYAPNGNYPEGPGYWNYGTSFQVMMFSALESALGSDNGLSKAPGFMESACYMIFSTGTSGNYFNYYDGSASTEANSSMFWFADKLKDPSLLYFEIPLINNGKYTQVDKSDAHRYLPNAIIFGKDLTLSKINPPVKTTFNGKGMTPISIARTSWEAGKGKYLGMKAGKASDPHGHMDQGTFVYDIGNLRWAMDFGLQSYITLESKGVDLWNMSQNSQRWDIFRYNNFNHNTLSINNQLHNVEGRSEIIKTYENKNELGAKVDLAPALNLNNELKTATRKATIVDDSYLRIEDVIETNDKPVNLRWNMATPAFAEIVDKNTIKLSQQGKILLVKFSAEVPFKLAIRPSENPSQYKLEFKNAKYGEYNQLNKGSVMIGFDSKVPANKSAKFTISMVEGKPDLMLKKNTIIFDAPNPNTAPTGNNIFDDNYSLSINADGELNSSNGFSWTPYGVVDIKNLFNKSIKFKINAKRIGPKGVVNGGIDRSSSGQLGVRGGESTGIDPKEGYLLSLDLKEIDPSAVFNLTKIAFTFLDASESCTMVSRIGAGKMLTYKGEDQKQKTQVKVNSNHKLNFVDVSDLGVSLKGGLDHTDFLSLFNTGDSGSFRIAGFEFVIQ